MDAVESDKKRESNSVNFVLIRKPGDPFIKAVDFAQLNEILEGILSGDGGCI
jgi:3-dehydroquinate synthetase